MYIAWRLRKQTKGEFLASNRTQTGQNYLHSILAAHPDSGDAVIPERTFLSYVQKLIYS